MCTRAVFSCFFVNIALMMIMKMVMIMTSDDDNGNHGSVIYIYIYIKAGAGYVMHMTLALCSITDVLKNCPPNGQFHRSKHLLLEKFQL